MILQQATGLTVMKHSTKKPGCGSDILDYFVKRPETGVSRAKQIAIVGDRLMTDIAMANLYGFRGIWVRDGVSSQKSWVSCFAQGPTYRQIP